MVVCNRIRGRVVRNFLGTKIAPLVFTVCFLVTCIRVGYISDKIPATLTAYAAGFAVFALFLLAAIKRRKVHSVAAAIGFFSAAVVFSTLINGGNCITALYEVLPPLAVALLFGTIEQDALCDYLDQFAFWGGLLIILDGLTMLAYPNGMYASDLYANNWLLGYKTQRVWFGLPITVLLCVNSYRKKGKLGAIPIMIGIVLALTSRHAGATMGTVAVVLLIACFYIMKLAANRWTSLFVRWVLDFRVWAIVSVIIAASLVLSSNNGLALQVSELFNKSPTLSGREVVWNATIAAWVGSPLLGIGALTSSQYIALTGVGGGTNAHNLVLAILQSSGIVGFASVLIAFILAFRSYKPWAVGASSILASGVVLCLFIGITSCNAFELFTLPLLVLLARANEEEDFLNFS